MPNDPGMNALNVRQALLDLDAGIAADIKAVTSGFRNEPITNAVKLQLRHMLQSKEQEYRQDFALLEIRKATVAVVLIPDDGASSTLWECCLENPLAQIVLDPVRVTVSISA